MQLIRSTKKLRKEMGLKEAALSKSEPDFSRLAGWHANLIFIHRRKCVLYVNDKTLFNFIVPDVSQAQHNNTLNPTAHNMRLWEPYNTTSLGFPCNRLGFYK